MGRQNVNLGSCISEDSAATTVACFLFLTLLPADDHDSRWAQAIIFASLIPNIRGFLGLSAF